MQDTLQLLEKTLPVFILLGLGVLCREARILTRDGVNALKKVAVDIALPAVMFSAFATAEYTASSICVPLLIFSLCLAALALGHALCRALHIPGKLSPFLAAGFEAGMLGYSFYALLYPQASVSSFAMIDLGQVLFVFTVYKILLAGHDGIKDALKEAATSPTIWAILAGLLFGATGLYRALQPSGVSSVVDAITDLISAPTSTLILLAIGYDLAPASVQWRKIGSLILLRLSVSGALLVAALLIDRFILGGMMHTPALVLMFILPPPFVLPVFADLDEERGDISSALSALTLVSILLYAILALFA